MVHSLTPEHLAISNGVISINLGSSSPRPDTLTRFFNQPHGAIREPRFSKPSEPDIALPVV